MSSMNWLKSSGVPTQMPSLSSINRQRKISFSFHFGSICFLLMYPQYKVALAQAQLVPINVPQVLARRYHRVGTHCGS
jgi:hypothetical protein